MRAVRCVDATMVHTSERAGPHTKQDWTSSQKHAEGRAHEDARGSLFHASSYRAAAGAPLFPPRAALSPAERALAVAGALAGQAAPAPAPPRAGERRVW